MTDAEVSEQLQLIVGLMAEIGFALPTAVMAEHRGQPIAGVRGRWNGEVVESTFYRGHLDATSLRNLKAIVRAHPAKHPLRPDA